MPPSNGISRRRPNLRKLILIAVLGVVAAAAVLAAGYYFFAGWRARDLAIKARASFVDGNYRMAWMQLLSARGMRKEDPEVIRTGAFLETRLGLKEAVARWEQLAQKVTLTEEDRHERNGAILRYGTDEEFQRMVDEVAASGDMVKVGTLRTSREVLRGNLQGAIDAARSAAESTGDPFLRLDVAKLLRKRYSTAWASPQMDAAKSGVAQEVAKIVDSLLDTAAAEPALAFGLGNLPALPDEIRHRWTARAMQRKQADNPALLPAAEAMVQGRDATPAEVCQQLLPVYEGAPLDRRASFSLWLSSRGLASESLGLITAQEASENQTAFIVRTDALGQEGNWALVITAADSASSAVPESVRLLTRARAVLATVRKETKSKDDLVPNELVENLGLRSLKDAIQASAREGRLESTVASADTLGPSMRPVVNEELLKLCSRSSVADTAFSLLRRRLGSAGTSAVVPAWQLANDAMPTAPSVRDFTRYKALFEGGSLFDPEEAAAAVAEAPADPSPRINQSLLLIRLHRPEEAAAVFKGFTVKFDELAPGQQTVLAAAAAAGGDTNLARSLRKKINLVVLTPGEKALLDQFVPQP